MEQDSIYRRFHRGFQFFVRYLIASTLIFYAAPKLMGVQFQLYHSVNDMPVGRIGDMAIAWSFFARSYYYQLLIGLAEITVSLLLLFRRTKILGLVCTLPIVTNILMVDYFFNVKAAMPVAVVLFASVVYLLALELPKLKAFFWDAQRGAAGKRTSTGGLIYGIIVLCLSLGLLVYLTRTYQYPQEGAYKIERYTVNGTALTLGAGQYVKDPILYLEFGNFAVLNTDDKKTYGEYELNTARQEFSWTPDQQNSAETIKGNFKTDGDQMILKGKCGTDDVEIVLKRIAAETL